jgi:hypothetical protein
MIRLETIDPRNNQRGFIEFDLSDAVMTAAKHDLAVSKFVAEMARERMPESFMLLAELRTP